VCLPGGGQIQVEQESLRVISVEVNELSNTETRQATEAVICKCIGERPGVEDWKIWIYSSANYSQVVIQGPNQKRERFFFDGDRRLPEEIREWLESYPFR
jgi:hypothetical protein